MPKHPLEVEGNCADLAIAEIFRSGVPVQNIQKYLIRFEVCRHSGLVVMFVEFNGNDSGSSPGDVESLSFFTL